MNEDIDHALGDIDADKESVVFHNESMKVKDGCQQLKLLQDPMSKILNGSGNRNG
ncbi:hypothetical protein ACMA1I_19985 [Pontibacter sp. 13R65]|uniref:hypothetical protein n=1 Tax=Pontibacter sp. 13R65 TaxID=3127458 RepID=UPI00301E1652